MNLNNEAKAREILARSPWCSQQDALKAWDEAIALLNAAPEPWNGEGLPPVGAEIEAMMRRNMHDDYAWHRAKVVHGALPHSPGEVLVFGLETTSPSWVDEFRPIRTPEQIAAEERDTAVQEMREIAGSKNAWPFEQLYDAGYRKQPVP
ncbi:hypothetical protein KVQ82_16530 [Pseudomonas sp. AO-1]|uniref:hypothetical protein n=1 Tax=Pseudomonas sp. AO-1 TaxID=2855434 RepID=UPI001C754029|nr:hypothetical protein [Pseudomonas sp. AO-1]QXZ11698.1 hypothetical protein KVQ82_16530 [Pseudomonas sp. AO-1]